MKSHGTLFGSDLTKLTTLVAMLWVAGLSVGRAAEKEQSKSTPAAVLQLRDNESIRHEVQRAIDRGLSWLTAKQNSNGWWQTADHPAVTGLALMAYNGDPMDRYRGKEPAHLKRAYRFLLDHSKPNGSICLTNLPTYNTAISMMALLSANDPQFDPILRKARAFLTGVQRDFGETGKLDTPFDGGFGYGLPSDKVSDMSNTLLALEAMYYSKRLAVDQAVPNAADLDWQAAIHFLQSCQNLPSHNKEPWVSTDAKDRGGFVYHSGRSNAGGTTNAAMGRVSLRSYGSMSYAGLLSYIYADLKSDDPRVKAVTEWLKTNYTLEENPGMGNAGLFYYFHTMTKALSLSASGDAEVTNAGHGNWRQDLALKLIQLQDREGAWINENGRWWEKEPALVTSYALLTLEILLAQFARIEQAHRRPAIEARTLPMKMMIRPFGLQLTHVWRIARGVEGDGTRTYPILLVELQDSDGTSAVGETAPSDRYEETVETVQAFLRRVDAARLSFDDVDGSMRYLDGLDPGQLAAKCALNIALLDGAGQRARQPIYDRFRLGFQESRHVTSFSIGIDKPEVIRRKVLEAESYPVLKLKVGSPDDAENFAALRSAAPTKTVRVDANEAWKTKEEALRRIEWLREDGHVEFIEQPMPAGCSRADLRWLKERSPLPLFADESYVQAADIEVAAECFHGVNVKLVKTGGITGAHAALLAARQAGLTTMIGCMIESSVLITAAAHLAELTDHLDIDGNLLISNDPYQGVTARNGVISFSSAPTEFGLRVRAR